MIVFDIFGSADSEWGTTKIGEARAVALPRSGEAIQWKGKVVVVTTVVWVPTPSALPTIMTARVFVR